MTALHGDAAPRFERIPPADRLPRREALAALAFFALALAAYLAFLTANHSYDAVAGGVLLYQWLASGDAGPLFHRYHVLYLPAAAGMELLLGRIGLKIDPLTLLQMLSALFAAGSVALYYRLSRVLGLDGPLSAMLVLLFGGGFSTWYYATNGESYPISLFFLLLAFLSAARAPDDAPWARGCIPGAWLGLAACFHGTCLLALPGLVALSWPRARGRSGAGRVAATILAAGLVFGAPYLVRYRLVQRTDPASGIAADRAALAREEGWSMTPHLIDQWQGLAWSLAPTDRPSLPSAHPLLARAANLGLLTASLLPLALFFGVDRTRRRAVLAVAVWAVVGVAFFSMYYVGSPKFAIYQWAPLLLLAGFTLQQIAPRAPLRPAAAVILAAVVVATLFGSFDLVRRQSDPAANPHLARALAIARLTGPDDLVVHLGRGENQYQRVYTPYFAVRRSLALEQYFDRAHATVEQSMQGIESRLASAASGPGRIVALSDAVEAGPSSREFETAHGMPEGSVARFFAAYRPRLLAQDPDAGTLWLLTAPAPPKS